MSDFGGVVEDVVVPLEHACLGCAQREDLLPTVAAIAATGRWSALVLALPVGADPTPVLAALCTQDDLRDAVAVRGVVAAVEAAGLVEDLLGDALLSERGTALGEDDERAVGEALARQLDEADLVLTDGTADGRARTLLAHLCGPGVPVLPLEGTGGAQLVDVAGGTHRSGARADLLTVRRPRSRTPAGSGPWNSPPTARCTRAGCWNGSRTSAPGACAPAAPSASPPGRARSARGTAPEAS